MQIEFVFKISKVGVMVTGKVIKGEIKAGDYVEIIKKDGDGENQDFNRCKWGIFDKIISNLENLKAQKPSQMVDIKTIVLENNIDDLLKLYKLCEEMRFDFLSISFLRNNSWKQNSVLQENFIPPKTAEYIWVFC